MRQSLLAAFRYKIMNETLQNSLNLRNDNLYAIPHPHIKLFKKSPIYTLPEVWNELSINIRGQHNKTTFSTAKHHLLEHEEN